jgi:hypothetical protein
MSAALPDVAVDRSEAWRILNAWDSNRLPASQRYQRRDRKWKRYKKRQLVTGCRSTLSSFNPGERIGQHRQLG